MIKLAREDFLSHLRSLSPGLSPLGLIEGSNCFCFREGNVFTYNEEVACHSPSLIGDDFSGAVRADSLLKVLEKMKEDDISVDVTDKELIVVGKNKKLGVMLEKDISIPYEKVVESPDTWQDLHEDFLDAVNITRECTSEDLNKFELKYLIHIHPQWIEASDNFQVSRWNFPTGVSESILVRSGAIKHIVALGCNQCCETDTWIHFKNSSGLVLSCRRYLDSYKDFTKYLVVEGEPLTLPKSLDEAAERAEVFSGEKGQDFNLVTVELSPGKLKIEGKGITGWYKEVKKTTYKGPNICFKITPPLLARISKQYNEVRVSPTRLIVDGGKWIYFSQLIKPEDLELKEVSKPERGKTGSEEDE